MRIAQVAPLYESVPPKLYGGTERVVSWLAEELVELGHEVTVFASGDSRTRARLVPVCDKALRLCGTQTNPLIHHYLMLEKLYQTRHDYDIVHFHCDFLHFPLSRRAPVPHVSTLHGRLDIPDLVPLYREYREMPVISISDDQRKPLPWLNWHGTVYHGLPIDGLAPCPHARGGYLAFLGRISPEKRVDHAIEIARRAGREIRIAAKIDDVDRDYFERDIRPLMSQSHVRYTGEIGDDAKAEFLGNAAALLFPIDWAEPFGLVQIEAMACGTPVIAMRKGSVPEIIDDGVTGFVCNTLDDAVDAVGRVGSLSRARCREVFEKRFASRRMATDYLRVYERIAEEFKAHG